MKNWLKISLIITLILGSLSYGGSVLANPIFTSLTITSLKNGVATLQWNTQEPAKGVVYFGETSDNLNRHLVYNAFDRDHQSYINGLEKDKTYYYKIIAENQYNQFTETFVQNFDTEDMIDTIAPEFLSYHILQSTDTAVALSWHIDEEAKVRIHYGSNRNNLNKEKTSGAYERENYIYIDRLEPYVKYYMQLTAEDRDGNKSSSGILEFRASAKMADHDLEITDLQPINFDPNKIFTNMTIFSWRTNFVAKTYIEYGTKSGRYSEKVDVTKIIPQIEHRVVLTDLEPNTTYYYKIRAYDALHGRRVETEELTFTTIPQQQYILGTKIIADDVDSDNDGLPDSYEYELGTNPLSADTDHDGYPDKTEVDHGYNPNGPGRLTKLIYGKPRISLGYEQQKAIELRTLLENRLGKLHMNANDWFTVVNAYVYGGYPVDAIVQSIRWGGKTVHPSIPWTLWKNTADYQNYINR